MPEAKLDEGGTVPASRRGTKYNRIAKWAIIVFLLALPPIIALIFIKTYGVNVCYWDQWEMVPLFDKLHTGHLTFMDLFAQHNEHRILFPRIVMLLLGVITHYNNLAEMYFSWFLLCLIAYLLFRIYVGPFGATKTALIKFIPIVWLVFSLRQWENLLWGFQIQFFMVVLFFILAVYLLATSKTIGLRLAGSVLSAIICTFSLSNGLLVWPIGLIQILLSRRAPGNKSVYPYRKKLFIWCLTGILAFVAYFIGYTKPSGHPSLFYFLQHPADAAGYFLAALGNPLASDFFTMAGIGIIMAALYIFIIIHIITDIKRKSISKLDIGLSVPLLLFGLCTIVLLDLGRSGFGPGQAASSRYSTLIVLAIIGPYLIILQLKSNCEKLKPFFTGLIISLFTLGVFVPYAHAITIDGKTIQDSRNLGAYYLVNFETQSDENLKKLYPDPQLVRERAEMLKKYKLNVFSSSP